MLQKRESLIERFEKVIAFFPPALREKLDLLDEQSKKSVCEIRVRASRQVELVFAKGESRMLCDEALEASYMPQIIESLCNSSIYSYQSELSEGFITLPGGSRAGICGRAVRKEDKTFSLRDISSINLRIAHEFIGIGDRLFLKAFDGEMKNTLIISPPGFGKTTLLRDLARTLSYGCLSRPYRISIADERSEITGMRGLVPGFDLGPRADVMDGMPKAQAIKKLIRSMSPEIIVTDEIGSKEDIDALLEAAQSGVYILASAHGRKAEDILSRPNMKELFGQKIFQNIVVLNKHISEPEFFEVY